MDISSWYTLGTIGGPIQQPEAFQISNLLEVGDSLYLFDVGNGVLRQMAKLDKPLDNLKAIFISHHHPDHIADLGLVILGRWLVKGPKLKVVGPTGTKALVEGLCRAYNPVTQTDSHPLSTVDSILDTVEAIDTELGASELARIYQDDQIKVDAALVAHFRPKPIDDHSNAIGFRIDSGDRTFAYTGDTGMNDNLVLLSKGVDVLVSEVCDVDAILSKLGHLPDQVRERVMFNMKNNHISPAEIGEVAARAGVKQVLLTHYVPAPPSEPTEIERIYVSPISAAAQGVKVSVGRDLGRY